MRLDRGKELRPRRATGGLSGVNTWGERDTQWGSQVFSPSPPPPRTLFPPHRPVTHLSIPHTFLRWMPISSSASPRRNLEPVLQAFCTQEPLSLRMEQPCTRWTPRTWMSSLLLTNVLLSYYRCHCLNPTLPPAFPRPVLMPLLFPRHIVAIVTICQV